jgi:hydrogenase 3 maturation protease
LSTVERPARLALVGIGHELCGDDAVGLRIAGAVRPLLSDEERLLVVEAGPAPENFTGVLRRFKPDLILLVDSALMNEEPGAVRWLNCEDAEGFSASTHTLPLQILAAYLTSELGCTMGLIGIQPEQTFADAPLTPPVRAAADKVVAALTDCLKSRDCSWSSN